METAPSVLEDVVCQDQNREDCWELQSIGPGPFARVTFENTTPFWGGGPEGYAIDCLDTDCRKWVFHPPTEASIVGRMRWLARITFASFVEDEELERKGYRAVEERFRRVFNRLFGSSADNGNSSGLVIRVKPEKYPTMSNPDSLYAKCFEDVLQEIKENCERPSCIEAKDAVNILIREGNNRLNNRESCDEGVACLLTIPRFYLAALSFENVCELSMHLFRSQPVKPGGIRLMVELWESPHLRLSREEKLFALRLVVLTLAVLGLGKATSRGFGRFLPVNINEPVSEVSDDIRDEAFGLLSNVTRMGQDNLLVELEYLLHHAERLASNEVVSSNNVSLFERVAAIPRLSFAIKNAISFYVESFQNRVFLYFKMIGESTLKSKWKHLSPVIDGRYSAGYHTWVLGFPRSMKKETGYFALKKRNDSLENLRRVSSIHVFPHSIHGRNDALLLILPLASSYDIPVLLEQGMISNFGKACVVHRSKTLDRSYYEVKLLDIACNESIHIGTRTYLGGIYRPCESTQINRQERGDNIDCLVYACDGERLYYLALKAAIEFMSRFIEREIQRWNQ